MFLITPLCREGEFVLTSLTVSNLDVLRWDGVTAGQHEPL